MRFNVSLTRIITFFFPLSMISDILLPLSSDYKPSDECSSVDEYNLQMAEVDANAFASIVMADFFSVKPQWNGLSNSVICEINKRINIIIRELVD